MGTFRRGSGPRSFEEAWRVPIAPAPYAPLPYLDVPDVEVDVDTKRSPPSPRSIVDAFGHFAEDGSDVVHGGVRRIATRASQLGTSVIDRGADAARGGIGATADVVRGGLGRVVPKVVDFAGDTLGLGGVGGRVRDTIGAIRRPVERGIDTVVGGVVDVGRHVGDFGGRALDAATPTPYDFNRVATQADQINKAGSNITKHVHDTAQNAIENISETRGGSNVPSSEEKAPPLTPVEIFNVIETQMTNPGGGDGGGDNPVDALLDAGANAADDAADAGRDAAEDAQNTGEDAAEGAGEVFNNVTNGGGGGGGGGWPW
jgi:hypothetical protein